MNTNYNSYYDRLSNQSNSLLNSNRGLSNSSLFASNSFSNIYNQAVYKKNNGESNLFTDYENIFQRASKEYDVPVSLLKAVAKAESGFNANAVSSCGAQGIMQLMPGTAAALGVSNAFDPEQNIMGGAKYIKQMLTRYNGDVTLALAAYNAGAGNVKKYGGIPPFKETQNYITKVLGYTGENISIPQSNYSYENNSNLGSGGITTLDDNLMSDNLIGSGDSNSTDYMTTLFLLQLLKMRNESSSSIGDVEIDKG